MRCAGCNFVQFKEKYHVGQWNRRDKISFCMSCVDKKKREGAPLRCNTCGLWKREEAFEASQRWPACLKTRVCTDCTEKRQCRGQCGKYLEKGKFTSSEWNHAGCPTDKQGVCKDCMRINQETKTCCKWKNRFFESQFGSHRMWRRGDEERVCLGCRKAKPGVWKCIECKEDKCKSEYSVWLKGRSSAKKDPTSRCNECFVAQEKEANRIRASNMKFVVCGDEETNTLKSK